MNITSLGASGPVHSDGPTDTRTGAELSQSREVARAVQRVNQSDLLPSNRELSLSLDPATKSPVVKLVDTDTHQVIEQIPAEYVLRLNAYLESEAAQEQVTQETRK